MSKLLQVWQYGLPTAAERNLQDAINLAKQFGFSGLLIKALDGLNFMGNGIDPSPDAISSVQDAAQQAANCRAQGLSYYVWTVPHPTNVDEQARISADLANCTDGIFLDVEPYAQFWGAWNPVGLASSFMTTLRSAAPNAFVVLQPDPRPPHLDEIRVDEWMPSCNAFSGQHYWCDFQSAATDELRYAQDLCLRFGKPNWVTLPGNADVSTFPTDAIGQLSDFVVFRMGSTNGAVLTLLGQISQNGFTIADYINALGYIKGNLVPPLEAAVAGASSVDPVSIRATIAELRRVCNQFIPDDAPRRLWPSTPDRIASRSISD